MSIPPVVSDPKVCPARRATWENFTDWDTSHVWEPIVKALGERRNANSYSPDEVLYQVCRYCGGRKP